MSRASRSSGQREYDIVVTGATGFTGRLIAEYLCDVTDKHICLVGRNAKKLEEIAQPLSRKVDRAVATLDDHQKLVDIIGRAQVCIAAAGPYAEIGEPIVRACVDAKTHYVDLTGEPQFMKLMQQKYGSKAEANKTLVVHACGCDSIPYDIPVFVAAKAFAKQGENGSMGRVRTSMHVTKGGFSGGTFLSLIGLMNSVTFRELFNIAFDREFISPGHTLKKRWRAPGFWFFDSWRFGGIWAASLANRCTVYRTHGFLEARQRQDPKAVHYGNKLDYDDFIQTPDPISAFLISTVMALAGFVAILPGGAALLRTIGPKSGSGPSKKNRDRGITTWRTVARSAGLKADITLRAKGDPGYKATSGLISECALAVLKRDASAPGGFLTPALAFGDELADQLNKTDMFTFTSVVTR